MNEKNDNANCLNEEPLITADQVSVSNISVTIHNEDINTGSKCVFLLRK